MQVNSVISERYAQALFDIAIKQDVVLEVKKELHVVESVFKAEKNLKPFLDSPRISTEDKAKLIQKVFGPKMKVLTVNFLLLLLNRKRIANVLDACLRFDEIYRRAQKISVAKIESALPLNERLKKDLVQSLEKLTGQTIEDHVFINKDLLGGVRVQIGDMLLDGSIKNRLIVLKQEWNSLKVH